MDVDEGAGAGQGEGAGAEGVTAVDREPLRKFARTQGVKGRSWVSSQLE